MLLIPKKKVLRKRKKLKTKQAWNQKVRLFYCSFDLNILLWIEYFSELLFSELPLSDMTLKAIEELGFKKATEI